jgi:hypothetical protein
MKARTIKKITIIHWTGIIVKNNCHLAIDEHGNETLCQNWSIPINQYPESVVVFVKSTKDKESLKKQDQTLFGILKRFADTEHEHIGKEKEITKESNQDHEKD